MSNRNGPRFNPNRRRSRRNVRRNTGGKGISRLSSRVQSVRNRPSIRPRPPTFNNLAVNVFRRIMAYPSSGIKPAPDKPAPKSSWWLDLLEWGGSLALQLLGVWLMAVEGDRDDERKFAVTGCSTYIAFDSRVLLASSPLATALDDRLYVPFEQSRVLWIRVTVTPIVDTSVRGGSYACAMIPTGKIKSQTNYPSTFEAISLQPGSVIRPITKPTSVSWSPTLLEHAIQWTNIGDTDATIENQYVCAFVMAFSDLALNKSDQGGTSSIEYTPQKAGFELYIEGRVEVREPGQATVSGKLQCADPTLIRVDGYSGMSYVTHHDVKFQRNIGIIDPTCVIHDLEKMAI